jgi:hypothetical protein
LYLVSKGFATITPIKVQGSPFRVDVFKRLTAETIQPLV